MVAFGRLSYYEKTNLENFDWTDREGSRRCSRRTSFSHISAGDLQLIDPSDAYYKRGFANMAVSLTIHLWSRCVHFDAHDVSDLQLGRQILRRSRI